jgi:predicted NUDIX family NTP pyrophosphohydrolase
VARTVRTSAGILLFRRVVTGVEVLLVHPGGPFWKNKSDGVWSIPKGEYEPGSEDPVVAARREFREEIGHQAPRGPCLDLGEVTQKAGKRVVAFALEGDLDPATVASNTFTMEWPPKSGRTAEFPEVDRAAWFPIGDAHTVINAAQAVFLDRLAGSIDPSADIDPSA